MVVGSENHINAIIECLLNIANPLQHKEKGRPANKRYLSAIENHSNHSSNKNRNIQEETSDARRKRNKRQYSICKSWYHDS
ncbi:hypothetical protein C1645_814310 [Glomus cerebriforme]|uniref:Uncharacterized protein n=1 Tax=Glomus cerebriforme TaxID=658196 RepID=A0A397TL65_9GLOM|nr:hypothetical protein C1645_814310 [Glomus cerebriforme]